MTTHDVTDYRVWLGSFDHDDNRKAAEAALDALAPLTDWARGLLFPILAEAILMERRTQARHVERSVPIVSVWTGSSTVEQRRNRLAQTFPLPDGRRVSWLEATEADHLARVAYLRRHVSGVMVTIAEHEAAIGLLRDRGVSCLGEIGSEAVA